MALVCAAAVVTRVGEPRAELADEAQSQAHRWQQVALSLDVDATFRDCPTLGEFSSWVDELVGRAFVQPDAAVRLVVTVRPTATGELVAELLLPAHPEPQSLRRLRDRLGCEGMLRAMALSVSLLAQLGPDAAPPALERVPPSATGAGAGAGAGAAPAPANQHPEPPAPPAPAPAPLPPAAGPVPTQLPSPVFSPAPQAEPVLSEGSWSLTWFGLAAAGQNPGVGLGAGIEGRAHWEGWSMGAGGAYLASTGTEAVADERTVRVEGPTAEVFVAGCRQVLGRVWSACVELGYWWMFARGYQFDRNHQAVVRTPAVGAQLGATWAEGDAWRLGARIELLAPLQRVELEAVGLTESVWSMWPVVPRAAVALQWH